MSDREPSILFGPDMNHITLRDATEDDLTEIVDIYNQSIPAGRSTADTKPIEVAQRVAWFHRFLYVWI